MVMASFVGAGEVLAAVGFYKVACEGIGFRRGGGGVERGGDPCGRLWWEFFTLPA